MRSVQCSPAHTLLCLLLLQLSALQTQSARPGTHVPRTQTVRRRTRATLARARLATSTWPLTRTRPTSGAHACCLAPPVTGLSALATTACACPRTWPPAGLERAIHAVLTTATWCPFTRLTRGKSWPTWSRLTAGRPSSGSASTTARRRARTCGAMARPLITRLGGRGSQTILADKTQVSLAMGGLQQCARLTN